MSAAAPPSSSPQILPSAIEMRTICTIRSYELRHHVQTNINPCAHSLPFRSCPSAFSRVILRRARVSQVLCVGVLVAGTFQLLPHAASNILKTTHVKGKAIHRELLLLTSISALQLLQLPLYLHPGKRLPSTVKLCLKYSTSRAHLPVHA